MRKPSVRRRSFEGGDLNSAHEKALLFGNMVSVGAVAWQVPVVVCVVSADR